VSSPVDLFHHAFDSLLGCLCLELVTDLFGDFGFPPQVGSIDQLFSRHLMSLQQADADPAVFLHQLRHSLLVVKLFLPLLQFSIPSFE
jgi:hypothetical protein